MALMGINITHCVICIMQPLNSYIHCLESSHDYPLNTIANAWCRIIMMMMVVTAVTMVVVIMVVSRKRLKRPLSIVTVAR